MMTAQDFWDNRERAQTLVEEVSTLRNKIQPFRVLETGVEDLEVLKMLTLEESDPDQQTAAARDLDLAWASLETAATALRRRLAGEQGLNPGDIVGD